MYDLITSWENICQAYLDLYYSFTEKNKGFTYKATDGQTLYEMETDIEDILKEAQSELIRKDPLQPAKYIEIPKKNGGIRGIYILPVKERIKCQAVYRVLEPHFEEIYSPYLYSFRSSHPSYFAARAVRRFYLRHNNDDMHVLKMDFKDYSNYHDHKFILDTMGKHGISEDVRGLVEHFLHQPYLKDGRLVSRSVGSMQGMNLCPLFNNIYADHIDKYLGKYVHFYRRVGDDFIMLDRDKAKLDRMKKYVEEETKKSKLVLNNEKITYGHISEGFSFLGLDFNDGIVSFPKKSYSNIVDAWKKKLKFKENMPLGSKIRFMKSFLSNDFRFNNKNDREHFMHYVRSYNLVNDTTQVNNLSKKLFLILSKFFTGGTSHKKMAQTKQILKKNRFPSFSKLHYLYTNGKMRY